MSLERGNNQPDELDLLVGSTVSGKYHIDRLIGRGGMGAVFQATNAVIGKRVALKFLGADSSRDREAATRFQREAEAASLAESPHIVQIFDSGQSERGLPFLVMELLTGEDLRERLRREQRLNGDVTVRIAIQILKALKNAHAAGIVHRDLKPDNVFLCRRDDEPSFVKLVDFGISKLQRKDIDTLTHKGAVLGTAFYMSPEQAQSFPDVDGRTDLFSVGAILYEMLTGTPPHSGRTYEAVLIAICTKDAPDVREKAPEVPEKLARVVARALRRERSERYQTAGEMLEDLEAALRESRALAVKTRAGAAPAPRKAHAPERFRTIVFAVVAALGGFAIALYLVARAGGNGVGTKDPTLPIATTQIVTVPDTASPAQSSAPEVTPGAASAQPPRKAPPSVAAEVKAHDPQKPNTKRPSPAPSSGVAGGLGLSTREP